MSTCANCKWWGVIPNGASKDGIKESSAVGICLVSLSPVFPPLSPLSGERVPVKTWADFGCNQFEPKP
jgi:hypothetical protein